MSQACLLALTGCGSSTTAADAGRQDADSPESCGLLTDAQVAELAGQPVTQSRAAEVGSLPACLYMVENSDKVQVIDVPASEWSRELPALLDQVEQSGVVDDPATRDKFAAARKKLDAEGSLDDDAACALFSDLLEIQGAPAGESQIVNFVPTREEPQRRQRPDLHRRRLHLGAAAVRRPGGRGPGRRGHAGRAPRWRPRTARPPTDRVQSRSWAGYSWERTRMPVIGTVTAPEGSVKKSLPLSSTTMNAGKSSTSIFQTASMPSSAYSSTSTRP